MDHSARHTAPHPPFRRRHITEIIAYRQLFGRLEEAEETLRAIRSGEVDAIVVSDHDQHQIFTLESADRPYRLLVESMQEGAATLALDGLILYSNRRLAEMLRLPLEQVLGTAFQNFIVPPDQPRFDQFLKRLGEGDGHIELTVASPNRAAPLPCALTLSLLPKDDQPAICMVITDLTEQKRVVNLERRAAELLERERIHDAEKKAHAQVERAARRLAQLQSITALLSGALTAEEISLVMAHHAESILDVRSGMILLLNSAEKVLDAVQPPESTPPQGDSPTGGHPGSDAQPARRFALDEPLPMTDAARSGQPIWIESPDEWRARYPDSAARDNFADRQAWATIPLITKQGLIGVLDLTFPTPRPFSDDDQSLLLTIAQQFAQALDRALLYRAEREARREAETADLMKVQFLAMVSHELRTPLAAIKGFSSTLLSTDVSWDADSQHDYIEIIDEEADKLTGLIDQLLDVSRLTTGKLSVTPKPIALRTIVQGMNDRFKVLTPHHHLTIDVSASLPPIMVDSDRIMQVIGNLVGNAAKFSPEHTAIVVSASHAEGEDFVQVNVSDEGPGVPLAERVRVFEAFRQIEGSTHQTKGVGLGLAICKGIIDAHGGKIWITDKDTSGAVFSFTLPIVNHYRKR